MLYLPERKYTRLAPENYLGRQFYFVTLCCFQRRRIFTGGKQCDNVLEILRRECTHKQFAVHACCVMPDHLHFLCEGLEASSKFLPLMTSFRIKSSRRFSKDGGGCLWQRGYCDHTLRSNECAESVAWYIWMNPVRKGLVSRPQEYRYAESFTGWEMPTSWDRPEWTPPWKSGHPQKDDPTQAATGPRRP
jgi:putative transposase